MKPVGSPIAEQARQTHTWAKSGSRSHERTPAGMQENYLSVIKGYLKNDSLRQSCAKDGKMLVTHIHWRLIAAE
ncbi:hypothetical protein [Bradyrhizobium sacchari]|uniref:hypothetical protein n=1 Tax=Bradyrhizobium sacchari TaxID=1399419 RepID=UPI0010A9787F|nr:hypothetical protein [Bradyrhizobium sacchari]